MASLVHNPATWFLIFGIIIIIAVLIWYAIERNAGTGFWTILIVGIILIILSIIAFIWGGMRAPSTKKSKVTDTDFDMEDL